MKKTQEEEFIRIQDLWNMAVAKWPWFVATLAISLFVAFLYLAVTPPVFKRTASVLLRDNSKGGMSTDNSTNFSDLGLFRSNVNINNEILSLKSPLLMQEVVLRLKLYENYSKKGVFRDEVLYQNSPVAVVMDTLKTGVSFSCRIELLPEEGVLLSDLVMNGTELGVSEVREGKLSEPIATPWGDIRIEQTPFYSEKQQGWQIFFSQTAPSSVVGRYSGALSVALSSQEASIIDITVNDVSPRRAEDVVATLITVYNENWVRDKNQIAVSTSLFIEERLNLIERELGHVDDDISKYKSQNLMPDVQTASSLYMARSSENQAQLLALNTQHSIAGIILKHLQEATTQSQLLPANLGIANVNIEGQIGEYNTLVLRRNGLVANSSETNPLVLDINQSLASLRGAIINSIENLMVTLNTQIRDINKSERQTSAQIASNPQQAKYLLSVERQQKVKEALYLFLLQKREENQLSQAFTAYNTKIITPPTGSNFPTAPRKMSVLLVALVVGLLLPVVVIFLNETLNTTVRGRKDLAGLSLPFIGEIPKVHGEKKGLLQAPDSGERNDLVVAEGKRDYMNEAFRVVRTNLDFMINSGEAGQRRKVTMVTSFNVGSGKTFTTINLAVSMAVKGKKVLALDLDMRKATLSSYVGSPETGISNYLAQLTDDLAEITRKGSIHPNLDLIPVGTIPPNPAELLLEDRFTNLIDRLREEYDYIFIDCTPVEMVTDASIVGRAVDLTLFVVRAGLMDRRMLPEIEDIYRKGQFRNMSLLLNGSTYAQGRYGYNRYGYNYGYGSY